MKTRTALLLGASGLVGGHCLRLLLEDEAYGKVRTLVRRPLSWEHPRLEQQVIDFDQLEAAPALIAGDDVFCCLGTTMKQAGSRAAFRRVDFTYPHEIAKRALKNGAEQFLIITSLGAHPRSLFYYSRVKGDIEQAIRALDYQGVQIFRPSLLLGDRHPSRLGEKLGMSLGRAFSFLMTGPMRKYRPIGAETVASAMLAIAKKQPKGVNIFPSHHIQAIHDGKPRLPLHPAGPPSLI